MRRLLYPSYHRRGKECSLPLLGNAHKLSQHYSWSRILEFLKLQLPKVNPMRYLMLVLRETGTIVNWRW